MEMYMCICDCQFCHRLVIPCDYIDTLVCFIEDLLAKITQWPTYHQYIDIHILQ